MVKKELYTISSSTLWLLRFIKDFGAHVCFINTDVFNCEKLKTNLSFMICYRCYYIFLWGCYNFLLWFGWAIMCLVFWYQWSEDMCKFLLNWYLTRLLTYISFFLLVILSLLLLSSLIGFVVSFCLWWLSMMLLS